MGKITKNIQILENLVAFKYKQRHKDIGNIMRTRNGIIDYASRMPTKGSQDMVVEKRNFTELMRGNVSVNNVIRDLSAVHNYDSADALVARRTFLRLLMAQAQSLKQVYYASASLFAAAAGAVDMFAPGSNDLFSLKSRFTMIPAGVVSLYLAYKGAVHGDNQDNAKNGIDGITKALNRERR